MSDDIDFDESTAEVMETVMEVPIENVSSTSSSSSSNGIGLDIPEIPASAEEEEADEEPEDPIFANLDDSDDDADVDDAGDDEDEGNGDGSGDDGQVLSMKRKRKSEKGGKKTKVRKTEGKKSSVDKSSKKQKRSKFIDGEAEESDDEGGGEGGNGNDEEDEDGDAGDGEDEYKYDGFVVRDTEEGSDESGDDEDDDGLFEKTGDQGNKKSKKKDFSRLRKRTEDVMLDEDDLMLIEENQRAEGGDAGDEEGDGGDEDDDEEVIAPEVVKQSDAARRARRGFYDGDEEEGSMDGFIIDDGVDGDRAEGDEEGEDGADQPRRVRIAPAKAAGAPRHRRRDGPSSEAIDEVHAMFGEDFDEFDEDEEGLDGAEDEGEMDEDGNRVGRRGKREEDPVEMEAKLMNKVRSRYDRAQLVESFCTDRDDEIRKLDRPERFQDILVGRIPPEEPERKDEAEWMSNKLTDIIVGEKVAANPHMLPEDRYQLIECSDKKTELQLGLKEPIEAVLRFFQLEHLEVPFIWTHRRDYLHPEMTRRHLWIIFSLDERWDRLYSMKKRLTEQLAAVYDAAESAGTVEDPYEADERRRGLQLLRSERDQLKLSVDAADEDLQNAMNVVDSKDEEATAQDREVVEVAQEAVDKVLAQLAEAERALAEAREVSLQMRRKRILSSKYRPDAAIEVAKLFPRHKYQGMIDNSYEEQQLRDLFAFLTLLLKGAEAGSSASESAAIIDKDEDNEVDDETDREMADSVAGLKSSTARHIISMGKDDYKRYRRIPRLREFAEMFAIAACDFGEAIRYGSASNVPTAPPIRPEDAAADFVDFVHLTSPAAVIKATSVILASEYCAEPSVRERTKEVYRRVATISTRPTKKGANGALAINPFSPLFGIHYLDKKELTDFYVGRDRTLFLRILEAEKQGLITVRFEWPMMYDDRKQRWEPDKKPFLSDAGLMKIMMPSVHPRDDANPPIRELWDNERIKILELLIVNHLLPSLQQECRRELERIGKEAIVEEAAANFEAMLAVGPYRIPAMNSRQAIKDTLKSCPKRPNYYTVVSIRLGDSREPACLAYVDTEGTLRAQKPIPDKIWKNHKEAVLKEFIFDHRPDLIVLNSSAGQNALMLKQLLSTSVINNVAEMIRSRARDRRLEREGSGIFNVNREDADEDVNYNATVIIIKDELSSIYKVSPRAKKAFPEFVPGTAAAMCHARYVQEPLAEYCSLWTSANAVGVFGYEALFLDVHPLKHLLGNVKLPLLRALEHCLVDAVCEVGVDLHLAVNNDHLSPMLVFVAGLGLRKAEALKQAVRKRRAGDIIVNRNELLEKKLLGPVVWNNAASFLRITEDRLKDGRVDWDPLEDTRIHPECYLRDDFAPKICADALEVEHEPSKYLDTVIKQMAQSRKRLIRRFQFDEDWVDLWQAPRPAGPPGIYGAHSTGAVVSMRRPRGEYLQVRRVTGADGRETEVRKHVTVELDDAMALLELEEFANDLERTGHGKRLLQLQAIKEELRYPYLDLRRPLEPPDEREMFTIISGESDHTLYVGLKTGCTVTKIMDEYDNRTGRRKQRAFVRTDSGLRGSISLFEIFDDKVNEDTDNITDYLQVGMHTTAVVVGVDKGRISVDLSIKPKYLRATEDWWLKNRVPVHDEDGRFSMEKCAVKWWESTGRDVKNLFDRRFDEKAALKEFREAELGSLQTIENTNDVMASRSAAVAQNVAASAVQANGQRGVNQRGGGGKGGGMKMRTIYHPLFANITYRDAEERLTQEGKGAGEVLFRPSSKGPDQISITWAFQENWFKHFDVEERGKMPGQLELADQLYVKESDDKYSECFSSLDEITARYIEPMNDLVSEVLRDKTRFHPGTRDEVEASMLDHLRKFPKIAVYRMRFNRKPDRDLPGTFTLTWVDSHQRIKTGLITVTPKGFVPSEDKPVDASKGPAVKRKDLGCFKSLPALFEWFKNLQSRSKGAPAPAARPGNTNSSSSSSIPVGRKSRFEAMPAAPRPPPSRPLAAMPPSGMSGSHLPPGGSRGGYVGPPGGAMGANNAPPVNAYNVPPPMIPSMYHPPPIYPHAHAPSMVPAPYQPPPPAAPYQPPPPRDSR